MTVQFLLLFDTCIIAENWMLSVNSQTTIICKIVYLKKQSVRERERSIEREREREGVYDKIMIKPTLLQVW